MILLQSLKKIGNLRISIFVLGIGNLAALSKQRICFVKKENHIGLFGKGKRFLQMFFRFADVFIHNIGQIDLIKRNSQALSNGMGAHGFSGSRGTGEKDSNGSAIGIGFF